MATSIQSKTQFNDIQSASDVEQLVDAFYALALDDPVIGHYFTEIAQINLEEHLPKMYRFWSALILGAPAYQGNAFLPHALLNEKLPFEARHFDRWLALFFGVIDDRFEGPKAELAKKRARHIATALSGKLVAPTEREA